MMKVDGKVRPFAAKRRRTIGLVLGALVVMLAGTVIVGCFSPFQGEAASDSEISLDLSQFVGALNEPSQEGWVFDVFLFRPEHITWNGFDVVVTSRNSSVPINGNRFQRIVIGTLGNDPQFQMRPIDSAPLYLDSSGRATVTGIPVGGPYVMLVLVWEVDGGSVVDSSAWLSENGGELVTFTIKARETTKLSGEDIRSNVTGYFDDSGEYIGDIGGGT